MNPLVSVVIATYRRDDSLKRALESLATQSYTQFEIIVVDDNADADWNQRVAQITKTFTASYPNIALTLIADAFNRGSAEARNVGIEKAAGEYVTFLDDDDLYLPEKIGKQVSRMKDTGADYCLTDLYLYDESDKISDKRIRSYIQNTDRSSLLTYHLMYHMTGTDTFMFRKEYLNRIGAFDPIDVGDEFYLMQKAITSDGKFLYMSGCDVKAYVHAENGLSSGDQKVSGENALYQYKKTFFKELNMKEIRYIKVRHYAVIAFAALHAKKYGRFFINALKAFFISPIACFKILKNR